MTGRAGIAINIGKFLLPCIGVFITGALLLEAVFKRGLWCNYPSLCAQIADNPNHRLFGLPFAAYGLAGFLAIAVLWFCGSAAPRKWQAALKASTGISLLSTTASLFLQINLAITEHLSCNWCAA